MSDRDLPGVLPGKLRLPEGTEYFWYISLSRQTTKGFGRDEFSRRIFLHKSQAWAIFEANKKKES